MTVGLGKSRLGGPVVGASPLELLRAPLVGATGALVTESGEEAPVAPAKLQGQSQGKELVQKYVHKHFLSHLRRIYTRFHKRWHMSGSGRVTRYPQTL